VAIKTGPSLGGYAPFHPLPDLSTMTGALVVIKVELPTPTDAPETTPSPRPARRWNLRTPAD
jgi:hypothetical protein